MAAEKTLFLIAVEKTLLPMAENPGGGGGRGVVWHLIYGCGQVPDWPALKNQVWLISCSSIVWIVYRLQALCFTFFYLRKWPPQSGSRSDLRHHLSRLLTSEHRRHLNGVRTTRCEFLGVLAACLFLCFLHHLMLEQTKHFTGPDSLAAMHCFAIRYSVAAICFSGFLIIDGRVYRWRHCFLLILTLTVTLRLWPVS